MRFQLVLPTIYMGCAAYAWIDFARLPPDGLANLGLMLAVLPITLVDLSLGQLLGADQSLFIPSDLGYYRAHAVFFAPSAALMTLAFFLLGRIIDRRKRKRQA